MSLRRVLLSRKITTRLLLQETEGGVGSGRDMGNISSPLTPILSQPSPHLTLIFASPHPLLHPTLSSPSSLPSSRCHPISILPRFHLTLILPLLHPCLTPSLYLASPLPLTFTPSPYLHPTSLSAHPHTPSLLCLLLTTLDNWC